MPKINQKYYRKVRNDVKSFLTEIDDIVVTDLKDHSNIESTTSVTQAVQINMPKASNSSYLTDVDLSSDSSFTGITHEVDTSDLSSDSMFNTSNTLLQDTEEFNFQRCSDNISFHQSNQSCSEPSDALTVWAINHKITHTALTDLLKTLNPFFNNCLPLDARTLLNTPQKYTIKDVKPGSYFHFGLENCLKRLISHCSTSELLNSTCLEVMINIDGLPLSKSSSSQFYPILCSLVMNETFVDMIGIYHGYEKPQDPNCFLADFITEAIQLTQNGFFFNKHFSFKIKGFICDVPAKSFILFTKGHSGYFSCSKCDIEGSYINGRVCFPEKEYNLRTDYAFRQKIQEDHHTGVSLIEKLPNFNIIDSFVLDPMHLLYLGVVKKLIHLWINGRPPSKLAYKDIESLSGRLVFLKGQIPCEFNRKSRALAEYKRWKATEFRQFLLYTGPVVLKGVLSNDMYLNFLTLHIAVTILSSNLLQSHFINPADTCLKYFIETFIILYGKENVSHNIHNLVHLVNDSKNFGKLDKFSAFHFENYMGIILNMIRKSEKPLQQIIRRKGEINNLMKNKIEKFQSNPKGLHFLQEHMYGPLLNFNKPDSQYKKAVFTNFILKVNSPDNCCGLKDGSIVIIQNFIESNNKQYMIGQKFNKFTDFYTQLCRSSELGIYLLHIEDLSPIQSWNVNEISVKYILLHLENEPYVALPLVHI